MPELAVFRQFDLSGFDSSQIVVRCQQRWSAVGLATLNGRKDHQP